MQFWGRQRPPTTSVASLKHPSSRRRSLQVIPAKLRLCRFSRDAGAVARVPGGVRLSRRRALFTDQSLLFGSRFMLVVLFVSLRSLIATVPAPLGSQAAEQRGEAAAGSSSRIERQLQDQHIQVSSNSVRQQTDSSQPTEF